jgi:zinc transporter 7
VLALSALKAELEEAESPLMRQVFAFLFPFGPGWNSSAYPLPHKYSDLLTVGHKSWEPSTLAREYIFSLMNVFLMSTRVPNFILAFIPAQINPNTLNTMTAFAVCHPCIHMF